MKPAFFPRVSNVNCTIIVTAALFFKTLDLQLVKTETQNGVTYGYFGQGQIDTKVPFSDTLDTRDS